ncbi:putative ankyrin repeat protein R863 [Colletotrichum siamense]|nr:putative ankyrin repeat protein R863 [Colletotrichum siamense]
MEIVRKLSPAASQVTPIKGLQVAVNEFRKTLNDDQRSDLDKLKGIPDADAALVFTSQLNDSATQRKSASRGSRLISVLEYVRDSSVIIDTFVSSHPEIAALVWGSIKLTIQVVLNFASYYERVSDLFMQFSRDCPRFAEYQALFPNSPGLQKAVCDFNASIIRCCKHVVEAMQRPWQKHLGHAFLQSFRQEFNPDLEIIRRCGIEAKQEIKLAKARADQQDQRLQQMEREAATKERHKVRHLFSRVTSDLDAIKNDQMQQDIRRAEQSRRQLLDSLSSYDYLTHFKKSFGSGKTVLTASAVEHIYAHERRTRETVTFFFPHFAYETPPSAETTLRSIIRQSLDPARLSSDWEARLTELDRKPSSELGELTSLLQWAIDQSDIFYVFIDALDEFEPTERRDLLDSLVSVASSSRLRVFISSRESLSGELRDRIPTIGTILMASPEAKIDIATFVGETLRKRQLNGDLMVQDQSIVDNIRQALINRADGMFLWVTFLLDEICAQTCDDDIRDAVERLPKTLTETLSKALHRIIKQGKSAIANKAFQWIAIAKRPLTLDELREVISMKVGQPSSNPGQLINGIDRLPMWCGNLVRVDEESRTAEFAHKAVHKFIVEGSSGPEYAEFHFKAEDADHHAGEICVTYLNFSDFVTTITRRSQPVKINPTRMAHSALRNSWNLPKSISSAVITMRKNVQAETDPAGILATYDRSDDEEAINTLEVHYPFLKYASVHWIFHTTRFRRRTSSTWGMWQQLYTQKHGLAKMPWLRQDDPRGLNPNILPWSFANRHFALIRYLAHLGKIDDAEIQGALKGCMTDGDVDLASALLESSHAVGIASTDLLPAASGIGHINIVELLLSVGANVNVETSNYEQTALEAASGGGHFNIVELLLSKGANVNVGASNSRRTALEAASEGGHINIVELLLSVGANVNAAASKSGRTALEVASEGGYFNIVELLLTAGANVNAGASNSGRTALEVASKGGHIDVVEILLFAGANVNAQPAQKHASRCHNALKAVSERDYQDDVELLLSREAKVNTQPAHEHMQTALQAAAKGGYIEIVQRLLSAGANVNINDSRYHNALRAASEGGHINVVELLLLAGANVNGGHPIYQTALQAASEGGHIDIVARLRAAGAQR